MAMTMECVDESNMSEIIADLRKRSGFSARKLSRESGVNIATISRFENRKRVVSVAAFIKMAKTLGYAVTLVKEDF